MGSNDFFDQASLQAMREVEAPEGFAAWRDDYISLLAVLKKTPCIRPGAVHSARVASTGCGVKTRVLALVGRGQQPSHINQGRVCFARRFVNGFCDAWRWLPGH